MQALINPLFVDLDLIYDDSPIGAGDVVEFRQKGHTESADGLRTGHIYLVESLYDNNERAKIVRDSKGNSKNGHALHFFKKVKTYPGNHMLKGDLLISVKYAYSSVQDGVAIGECRQCITMANSDTFVWSDQAGFIASKTSWLVIAQYDNSNNKEQ